MAYENICNTKPVEKVLKFNGEEQFVYFRRLTAGENLLLSQGQKGTVKGGEQSFEIDMGDLESRNQRKLAFSNVTEDGKQVFNSARDVQKIPADLCDALVLLMTEALAETKTGNA